MQIINTIGRRKTSVARVYMKPGKGDIKVNNRDFKDYFVSEIHQIMVKQAFAVIKEENNYDVTVNVEGGGVKGQAEAAKLGIARALIAVSPDYRPALKAAGLLKRDPRAVERKKPGKKKARKSFQFSKR